MLVMALYNVVDRIFIGQCVGPEALAGLTVTFPLMNLTTAVGVLVGVGSSAKVSIVLGAGQPDKARLILGNALVLTLVNGLIYIAVFALYIDPLLRLFGASDVTLPYAHSYMLILLPGCMLTNIAFSLNNVIRASGYPGRAMATMIIGAAVNVALDPIFINLLGLGIEGAAWATDIAMAISAVFVLSHFTRPGVTVGFSRGIWRLNFALIGGIVAIGAAPAIVNAASCIVNALVNNSLLGYGSDRDIGAAGIMVTFTSLLVTIVLGICQGMQPIIGYNYGAGNHHRLRRTYLMAVAIASVVTGGGAILGLAFPRQIGMIFTDDAMLLDATEHALRLCLLAFPVVGFQVISTTLFQSLGLAAQSIVLGLLRQVVFIIPLLMILPAAWGIAGVWLSFPISDLLTTIVTIVLVVLQFRKFSPNSKKNLAKP